MSSTEQSIPVTAEDVHYCEVHPDRETSLRCNKCGRYMCVPCAVLTPVGYRCKQCVRQHEDKFYSGTNTDYIMVFAACAVAGGIVGVVSNIIPLGFLFAFIIAIPVGGFVSEVALRLVKRRRGRYSGEIAAAGIVLGGLAGAVIQAASVYAGIPLDALMPLVLSNISLLIYVGVVAFIVYGRFKMR
jgi:hypothetical protein